VRGLELLMQAWRRRNLASVAEEARAFLGAFEAETSAFIPRENAVSSLKTGLHKNLIGGP
jgi:hypothetical protein